MTMTLKKAPTRCIQTSLYRKRRLRRCLPTPHQFISLLFLVVQVFPWCDFDPAGRSERHSSFVVHAVVVTSSEQPDSITDENKNETALKPNLSAHSSKLTMSQILAKAGKRAMGGGFSGAVAGVVQVLALMWLRTITNYQYRYGTTFHQALQILLKSGGVGRLYRGLSFALVQAPVAKFAGVAANEGVLSFLGNFNETKLWGPGLTTMVSSIIFGLVRIVLMPIDTMKTVLQVDSTEGFQNLVRCLKKGNFAVLYEGAIAVAVMSVASYYPWFLTYNMMTTATWIERVIPSVLLRNAFVGFVASIASDIVANVFRVVKTMKQVSGSKSTSSYSGIIRKILAADGWKGLFGRGLRTRLATNALQSILFTIVWRGIEDSLKATRNHIEKEGQ